MKLVLCLMCFALTSANTTNVSFEKPRYPVTPSEIPQIFPTRNNNLPRRFPLAIEAVLSVALKLQAIEDHDGKQENFLVSPLAVAGALGQLMLGAKGDLKKQIGVLLTLHDQFPTDAPSRFAVPTQPQDTNNPATIIQQRLSDPVTLTSVKGSGNVASRFGTVSALNAGSYQGQRAEMPQLPYRGRDGVPGLELHRQLGQLIRELSLPLPGPGTVHPVANSSYLHISSAFFADYQLNLNEPFLRAIIDFYSSKVVPLNFRNNPVDAQNAINNWGSSETGGLINQFLAYPPPIDTAVIQAVAVHFRGAWQTPFIPEGTISGMFQTSANSQVPVKYMRGSFEQAFYAENSTLGIRLLAMPYSNFDCAMYVILPTDSNPLKYNVGHLISQLNSKNLADLVGTAKSRTVNVMFPKLSLTGSVRLADALEKHAAYLNKQKAEQAGSGQDHIFMRGGSAPDSTSSNTGKPVAASESSTRTPDQPSTDDPLRVIPLNAEKSGTSSGANRVLENTVAGNLKIAPRYGLNGGSDETTTNPALTLTGAAEDSRFRVSDIIQQIALEVTEAGTEAAAIAGSTVNYSGDVKNFKVNRPFLFFIRQEETNAILFWGTIVDPTA